MPRAVKLVRRLVRSAFEVTHAVAADYSQKRISILAAALAYYVFLALLPFLLVLLAAAGYILGHFGHHIDVVSRALDRALPSTDLHIKQQLNTLVAHRAALGGLGLLGLFWSASNALAILGQALRIVWGVKRRTFLMARLRALGLLLLAVLLLPISILVTSSLPVISRISRAGAAIHFGEFQFLWHAAAVLVAVALSFVTFLALYRTVPAPQIRLRHIAAAAGFAAVVWELAKRGFTFYLERFGNFNKVYGPLGAIVVLLLWIYISAVVVLIGAELAQVYSQRERGDAGDRQTPRADAGAMREVR